MAASQKYLQRGQTPVAAVLLNLETDGFTCRKWGGEQTCKPGDWIVDNASAVYTLDCDSFARTDCADSPDLYRKVAPNWAGLAHHDAAIKTKEDGLTLSSRTSRDRTAMRSRCAGSKLCTSQPDEPVNSHHPCHLLDAQWWLGGRRRQQPCSGRRPRATGPSVHLPRPAEERFVYVRTAVKRAGHNTHNI